MGGTSSSLSVNDVTNITTRAITNTANAVNNTTEATQSIIVNCDVGEPKTVQYQSCLQSISSLLKEKLLTKQQFNDLFSQCQNIATCTVANVTMKTMIHFDDFTEQISNVQNQLSQNLTSQIKAGIDDQAGFSLTGDDVNESVNQYSNYVTSQIANVLQTAAKEVSSDQIITVQGAGGSVKYVTMTGLYDVLSKSIQNLTEKNDLSQKVVNSVDAEIRQHGGTGRMILTIVLIVAGVLLLIGLVIWLFRMFGKNKGEKDKRAVEATEAAEAAEGGGREAEFEAVARGAAEGGARRATMYRYRLSPTTRGRRRKH